MANDKITKPGESPEELGNKGEQTPAKTVEELQKELKEANEKSEILAKEKDVSSQEAKHWKEVAGRQSNELGELRKDKPEPPESSEKVDADIADLAKSLEKEEGMDKETALYNAKLLIKTDKKLQSKRLMNEVSDLIEEAIDEGKIDKKIYEENQDAIFEEFRGRKVAPTARKNFKIFRDCVNIVTKRKAEELRKANEIKDEEKRTNLIDAGAQAPGGGAGVKDTEAEKLAESIRKAGTSKDSVFF